MTNKNKKTFKKPFKKPFKKAGSPKKQLKDLPPELWERILSFSITNVSKNKTNKQLDMIIDILYKPGKNKMREIYSRPDPLLQETHEILGQKIAHFNRNVPFDKAKTLKKYSMEKELIDTIVLKQKNNELPLWPNMSKPISQGGITYNKMPLQQLLNTAVYFYKENLDYYQDFSLSEVILSVFTTEAKKGDILGFGETNVKERIDLYHTLGELYLPYLEKWYTIDDEVENKILTKKNYVNMMVREHPRIFKSEIFKDVILTFEHLNILADKGVVRKKIKESSSPTNFYKSRSQASKSRSRPSRSRSRSPTSKLSLPKKGSRSPRSRSRSPRDKK